MHGFAAKACRARVVGKVVSLLCLLLLALLPAVAACGGDSTGTSNGATGSTSGEIQGKQVTFKTEDGITLSGHLFGAGAYRERTTEPTC